MSDWRLDHDPQHCPGIYSCGQCIRGILCPRCNLHVGAFDLHEESVAEMLAYVRRLRVK